MNENERKGCIGFLAGIESPGQREISRQMKKAELRADEKGRIVVIGGTIQLVKGLHKNYPDASIIVVDRDENNARELKDAEIENVHVVVGKAPRIPIEQGQADQLLVPHLLHFVPKEERTRFVEDLINQGLTTPEGSVIFTLPFPFSLGRQSLEDIVKESTGLETSYRELGPRGVFGYLVYTNTQNSEDKYQTGLSGSRRM